MDIFFNELSVKPATDDNEAYQWLENLAELGLLLKQMIESLDEEHIFSLRISENFADKKITQMETLREFLISLGHGDAVCNFLYGIFNNSPYIVDSDPQRTDYDLTSISINNADYEVTGIAAAYLKDSLAISLNSDEQWSNCQLDVYINKLNPQAEIITELKQIRNASEKNHIINCHLPFLAQLYNWECYKPEFDPNAQKQSILPLIGLCIFYFGENWDNFHHEIKKLNSDERVSRYKEVAEKIAKIHRWERASHLEKRNNSRVIYKIQNSNFIIGLDTEQGEFEIHENRKGNNHLGAISFNGKNFKNKVLGRYLNL